MNRFFVLQPPVSLRLCAANWRGMISSLTYCAEEPTTTKSTFVAHLPNCPGAYRPESGRFRGLRFLNEEGRLVGAGAPTGRDSDVEHAQIHAELAAMLVPVAEHDVADEVRTRLGDHFPSAGGDAPRFIHRCVVELGKEGSHGFDAFLKFVQDFLAAGWLRKAIRVGEVGRLCGIVLHEANDSARNGREVIRELASRHRLVVRLPGELVFGKALDESPRDWGLCFEFGEEGFCNRHGDSPFEKGCKFVLKANYGSVQTSSRAQTRRARTRRRADREQPHDGARTWASGPLFRARGFGACADAIVNVRPAGIDTLAMLVLNQAKRRVMKFDQRAAFGFAQAVLDVGNHRIGHKKWAGNFEEGGSLDGLDDTPEMAIAIAEVAKPATAGPSLDFHGHGLAIGLVGARAKLFEQGGKGDVERCANVDLLRDVQCQVVNCRGCGVHVSSSSIRFITRFGQVFSGGLLATGGLVAVASARSFTRKS